MKNWVEQLKPIIDEYKDGDGTLDKDEVRDLCFIIEAKINLSEGNITQKKYDELLG
jgi:hypothetical protein